MVKGGSVYLFLVLVSSAELHGQELRVVEGYDGRADTGNVRCMLKACLSTALSSCRMIGPMCKAVSVCWRSKEQAASRLYLLLKHGGSGVSTTSALQRLCVYVGRDRRH